MAATKSRVYKCALCGEQIPAGMAIKIGKKNYHEQCAEEGKRIEEEKAIAAEDWSLLFDYICKIYKIDKPTGMMFKQLKTFRDDYEYTDFGMYYALRYFYEVLDSKLPESDEIGLGIIPYVYNEAKNHYSTICDLEEKMETFEPKNEVFETKIKPKKGTYKKKKLTKEVVFNIEWEDGGMDGENG